MLASYDSCIFRPFENQCLADADFLLSALPAVTCLEVGNRIRTCPESRNPLGIPHWSSEAFLNHFARLQKLSLSLQGSSYHVARLAWTVSELEALTFTGDCKSLLSHLRRKSRLTKLKALHGDCPGNFNMTSVPGIVFTNFLSLQELCLHGALDMKQWNEDVKCLAVLTDLRVLDIGIRSRESIWHVTTEELTPLTALKHLQNLELSVVSASVADVTEFWEAMKAIRYEMGFSCSVVPSHEGSRLKFVF
jgi:hypothetical protein